MSKDNDSWVINPWGPDNAGYRFKNSLYALRHGLSFCKTSNDDIHRHVPCPKCEDKARVRHCACNCPLNWEVKE